MCQREILCRDNIFVGPPTLPKARLESSSRGDSVLLAFSWSPSFSPYSIPVTYKVAVENGSGGNMFSNHTKSTSFLYTPPGGFCSTLTFKVFATNEAGKSNVSAIEYSELASKCICVSLRYLSVIQLY